MGNMFKKLTFVVVLILVVISLLYAAGTSTNGSRTIQSTVNFCADAGASDAYACNMAPPLLGYITGSCYIFKANTANTGAATIAFNGLASPVTIVKVAGGITTALADNDIRAGQYVNICYDGTNMQMQSTLGNTASGVTSVQTLTGAVTLFTHNAQTGTYQVLAGDFSACKTITVASGTFNITLVASGSQPPDGQCIRVMNYGTGTVTIVRSGQNINGATTSLTLLPASSSINPTGAFIHSDGTNYFADLIGPPVCSCAFFSANGGSISGLVTSGIISNVTRASLGNYSVTFSPNTAHYTVSIQANDNSANNLTINLTGTDTAPVNTGFSFKTLVAGVAFVDPDLVMVTVTPFP